MSIDGSIITLEKEKFDIVCSGAAIGYSINQEKTLKELLELVKPGGYFIDIEMNENILGKTISSIYNYSLIPINEIKRIIESEDYKIKIIPFQINNFPANLTRTCLIAKKNENCHSSI